MRAKRHKSLWLKFDRTLSQDSLRQVLILLIVFAVAFLASLLLLSCFGGSWQNYCSQKHINKWVFPLYLLIDGNAFNGFCSDKDVSQGAVVAACLIYLVGVIVFTGMIISVMTNMIDRRVENYRNGRLRYLKSEHYIIMGFGDMVPSFIYHIFRKDPDANILLLSSVNSVLISEKLQKSLTKKQLSQVIINYGHRTSVESYGSIHLESAREVFIVGYQGVSAHDAVNIECVDCICEYLSRPSIGQRPGRITCVFRDLDTYAAFKTSEIFNKVRNLGIEFIPYNSYAGWAKQVFVKQRYKDYSGPIAKEHQYPSVYGAGITPDDPKHVHLVFVGTTNFAVAFAMEAANVLHFPNFQTKDARTRIKDIRTRITFIDVNADKEKDEFITRNRHFFEVQSYIYRDFTSEDSSKNLQIVNASYFGNAPYVQGVDYDFLDVEFEFIKGDIFSRTVQDEISRWAKDKEGQYLSIFLALADQRKNFVMGMNMPDEVYDNEIPVFIRQDRSDNFVKNLREADQKKLPYYHMDGTQLKKEYRKARYANIYPFGMNESAYSADEVSLKRAKLINYLYSTADYLNYKFKGQLMLDAIPEETLWKEADGYWRELSVALKWSNLYSAYTMRTKLASLRAMRKLKQGDVSHDTWTLNNQETEAMAQVEHNRWNVEKLLMGYRKPHRDEDAYGNMRFEDNLKRNKKLYIHHDIRPYGELGDIRKLDEEFSRYIPWIIKMTDKDD